MEFLEESLGLYNGSYIESNSTDLDDGDEVLPTGVKISIAVVYMIVCVVGLIGNSLVMYVIIRYTKMNTATYIYIFNLALADFLVLATLPFQGTDVLLDFWPFGLSLCKIVVSIDYYNMFTSVFTLTVMSVDRYIAVCHPVRSLAVRTTSKAKVVNVGVWVLASAIGVPVMVMGQLEVEPNGIECMVVLPKPRRYWEPVFGTCVFLFSFLLPVAIISVCYGLMVRRLHSVRLLSGSREKDRYLRRITQMVLAVVLAFVVCWAPVQVLALIQALGGVDLGGSETSMVAMHFCIALGYANSSLNPLLYAFLDENFKRCFRASCPHRGLGDGFDAGSRRKSSRRSNWFGREENENGIAHGDMEMADGIYRQPEVKT